MTQSKYTRKRVLKTRWSVRAADKLARISITIGGIGTILAVSAVLVFLVSVVIPLFLPGSAREERGAIAVSPDSSPGNALIHLSVDEYRVMGFAMHRDGAVRVFRLETGEVLDTIQVVNGDSLSAWSFPLGDGVAAFGFLDGTVRLGSIQFVTEFLAPDVLPADVRDLGADEVARIGSAIAQKTPEGQFRLQRLDVNMSPALPAAAAAPIVLIDHVARENGAVVCALSADGRVALEIVSRTTNLLTGAVTDDVKGCEIQITPPGSAGGAGAKPTHLMVSESGTGVYLLWPDGTLVAYDARDLSQPRVAGSVRLSDGKAAITVLETLSGGATFLTGDSEGRVSAWFQHATEDGNGLIFSRAHQYKSGKAPVTAIASSTRGRVFAVGYGDGTVRMFQATSRAKVLAVKTDEGSAVIDVAVAPKNDGLVAVTNSGFHHWEIDLGHPEATLRSLFMPVWYEGYDRPAHVWQSSSASDDFEAKLGLWPLVFGTLKATLYSMLFGVPLALLAAIFTSEFMSPSVRTRVKTFIESMASLPSVVLGFLAALVFAPFVQRVVPSVLVGFLIVPGVFLTAAYLWQLLPQHKTLRMSRYRLWFLLALLPLSVAISAGMGPWVEKMFFDGDVILWLDGQRGSGFGGWTLLLLPVTAVTVIWIAGTVAEPFFAQLTAGAARRRVALLDITRFAVGAVLTILAAMAAAAVLTAVGIDPRGPNTPLHTYVQRNALVVGFVMGFAIIPIIYTIAEDALSAVPDHLRAASLGSGATQWQTAVRIVLPTAMSGLFSAVMIGLGRAVGETMIVLMAAGNTPLLEMNIFNGFRTLSANIAVELPEAVRDSTHYRTLFLAALILFAMTFIVNTIAEVVRLRFRRRSAQI